VLALASLLTFAPFQEKKRIAEKTGQSSRGKNRGATRHFKDSPSPTAPFSPPPPLHA